MNFCLNFPLFLIVLGLMSAVISSLLPAKAARALSTALSLVSFTANLVVLFYVGGEGANFTYMMGHYPHPWGNELKIGLIEALFSCLLSLVMFLNLLGGRQLVSLRVRPEKENYYYVMADLVQTALTVLIYTNDIFTGYVFIEICTLSSCGLLMIRQTGKAILASVRYMIFSLIGSGLFLLGVIFLYNITGHLLMPNLKESVAALWAGGSYHMPLLAAICLICIGLAVKSGLFPFHLWMADTYGAAVPASSGILSGLVSKAYILFLLKLIFDVFGTEVFYACGIHQLLFAMGAAGIIIGSVGAIRENNIFRMIAYSSAAQIAYIYMGIGLSASGGLLAAFFQVLAHAVTKPLLFLAAGQLSLSSGKAKHFHDLQGAAYRNPLAGATFTIGALSMIGVPFTVGFISKFLFGSAAFDAVFSKQLVTLLVLAASTVLNTLYYARTVIRLYNRPQTVPQTEEGAGKQTAFLVGGTLFAAAILFLGTVSAPLIELLDAGIRLF